MSAVKIDSIDQLIYEKAMAEERELLKKYEYKEVREGSIGSEMAKAEMANVYTRTVELMVQKIMYLENLSRYMIEDSTKIEVEVSSIQIRPLMMVLYEYSKMVGKPIKFWTP